MMFTPATFYQIPAFTISGIVNRPVPKTIALAGVATGNTLLHARFLNFNILHAYVLVISLR